MEKIIPQIKIRKYKEGDFKRAVELDKEAQINQKLKKIYPLTRSDIIRMSPAKWWEFVVVEYQKIIIGIGGIRRTSNSIGELKHIRITPAFKNKGIGSILITYIEKKAKQLHYTKIKCATYQARKFYEKIWYTFVRDKIYSDGLSDSIMEKNI